MEEEIRVEQLSSSDRTEVLEVIAQAFQEIPKPTMYTAPRIVTILMSAIQRLFGENTWMRIKGYLFMGVTNLPSYGIRKDGKLVCVAILSNSAAKPKISILATIVLWPIGFLIALVLRMGRILRWRTALELEKVSKETTVYGKGHYLELVIFGTLPAYQKQGLGREMLCFIYKKAESEGYVGISLTATKDTPAFHLYIKEGFAIDKSLNIASECVVLMQLTFSKNHLLTTGSR